MPPPMLELLVVGFLTGSAAMGATPFVYFWFLVPLIPALLGVVIVLVSTKIRPLIALAEGLFAATLFGVIFAGIAFIGAANFA